MSGTVISLFRCKCGRIRDEEDTAKEIPCPCGGRMFFSTFVTRRMVWRYLLTHPKRLWQMVKEGGFRRQAEPPPVRGKGGQPNADR